MKYIITAEGIGNKLWPLNGMNARKIIKKDKKGKTLLQHTYSVLAELAKPKDIITIADILDVNEVKKEIETIFKNPIILTEPMDKLSGIRILSALKYIENKRDETVIIIPSLFGPEDKNEIKLLTEKIKKYAKTGKIFAAGIKPLYADTAASYIKCGEQVSEGKIAEKFIVNPSLKTAEALTAGGNYWNSGIYGGKVSAFTKMFNKCLPEVSKKFTKEMFNDKNQIKYELYDCTKELTIESVIEKNPEKAVILDLNLRRKDYYTWENIYLQGEKDKNKNVIYGNVITNDVKNSIIYSSKELVSVTDADNIIVAETEDCVLVSDRSKVNKTGELIQKIKEANEEILRNHRTVSRPWGYYTCLNRGKGWLTKIITVMAGHKLSLQSHNYRSEHWVILSGKAAVVSDGKTYNLTKGQSIDIPVKSKHSLKNSGNELLKILEVQKGEKISEEDIIRYEDMYGRV